LAPPNRPLTNREKAPHVHETRQNTRRSSYKNHPPRKSPMCGWQIKIFDGDKSRGVANATWVGSFFSRKCQTVPTRRETSNRRQVSVRRFGCLYFFCPNRALGSVDFFARTEQRCEHPTFRFVGCRFRTLKDMKLPEQSDSRDRLY